MTINPIKLDNRNYWYIRTDKGVNFENFYEGKFVAIGWNEITIHDLDNYDENHPALRKKVELANESDLSELTEIGKKSQITLMIKKNITFHKMRKGDIVIIPSKNTEYLAFGIIEDDKTYTDIGSNCSYVKRRKVKWLKTEDTGRLDAKFSMITKSFHAISEIGEDYRNIVNNYMFDSYIIDGEGVISLKINTKDPIRYNEIKTIIDGIISIGKQYSEKNNLTSQNIEDVEIQINLQSPGFISLKGAGNSLIFSLVLLTLGCSKNPEDQEKYNEIVDKENYDSNEINQTLQSLDSIEVNL